MNTHSSNFVPKLKPLYLAVVQPKRPYVEFPSERLGRILGQAATSIAGRGQLPLGLACMSVLVGAASAVQGHVDVVVRRFGVQPVSLNVISLVPSTDGKGMADKHALAPHRMWEEELREKAIEEKVEHRNSLDVWKAARSEILARKKMSQQEKRAMLLELGGEPMPPPHWMMLIDSASTEGLQEFLGNSRGTAALVPTDGAFYTAGYAMLPERLLNTAAYLSLVWDGATVRKVLKSGVTAPPGVRLSSHIMLQPGIGASLVGNRDLNEQGMMSRFCVIQPDSLAGFRLGIPSPEEQDTWSMWLNAYSERTLSILRKQPPPKPSSKQRILDPVPLPLSDDAEAAWEAYREDIEVQLRPNNRYYLMKAAAARSAQIAARIAAIITAFGTPRDTEGLLATEVGVDVMMDAIAIARWFLEEMHRLTSARPPTPAELGAEQLMHWLTQKRKQTGPFEYRQIRTLVTPKRLRDSDMLRPAIEVLVKVGELTAFRRENGKAEAWALAGPPDWDLDDENADSDGGAGQQG